MAANPDGEPFIDLIFFGTHYWVMFRWDDTERWTILRDKKKKKRAEFYTATEARTEGRRILMATRVGKAAVASAEQQDQLGVEQWRRDREQSRLDDRRRVFGEMPMRTIFIPGGRQVEVAHVKKRVRA